jgi:uncharacterized protein (DUF302 family)
MLQVTSEHALGTAEAAIRRAAQQHGANILTVTHAGEHLPTGAGGAFVFGIGAGELDGALLAADIRMSAFLPCRLTAYEQEGRVTLASVSPMEFCRMLNRADLEPLAAPLEDLLTRIMASAAKPAAAAIGAAAGAHSGGLGATEDQMNARGAIPQRIDRHGSKVEDLAGTGGHDSQGG